MARADGEGERGSEPVGEDHDRAEETCLGGCGGILCGSSLLRFANTDAITLFLPDMGKGVVEARRHCPTLE